MTTFYTWNSCSGMETLAREEFCTLEAAKTYKTPAGGPNRITSSDGREWVRGAYADCAPQWFETTPDSTNPARPLQS